jgi:hypothetical protein
MVPLIADLLAKGLIEKRPVDGRSHALSLSLRGAVQRDATEAIMQAHEDRFEALIHPARSPRYAALWSRLQQWTMLGWSLERPDPSSSQNQVRSAKKDARRWRWVLKGGTTNEALDA